MHGKLAVLENASDNKWKSHNRKFKLKLKKQSKNVTKKFLRLCKFLGYKSWQKLEQNYLKEVFIPESKVFSLLKKNSISSESEAKTVHIVNVHKPCYYPVKRTLLKQGLIPVWCY